MTESVSRQTVRRIDAFVIETLSIPGVILMENAGRSAADVAERLLNKSAGKRVAVVAGAGNNGGDGFVIARHLMIRGFVVETFLVAPEEKISGDARINLNALRSLELPVLPVPEEDLSKLHETLKTFDLIVDAVGGTGITGALQGTLAAAVRQINDAECKVLAVDIPTGLDCDTGQAEGPTVRATATVTFVAPKQGFSSPEAGEYVGEVYVVDIGIPFERIVDIIAEYDQQEN